MILVYQKEIDNLDNVNECANIVLSLRETTDNIKKYNRIPKKNYTFLELYNYLLPLIEPKEMQYLNINKNTGCNCITKKLKKYIY